jgi:hypothetical protein
LEKLERRYVGIVSIFLKKKKIKIMKINCVKCKVSEKLLRKSKHLDLLVVDGGEQLGLPLERRLQQALLQVGDALCGRGVVGRPVKWETKFILP